MLLRLSQTTSSSVTLACDSDRDLSDFEHETETEIETETASTDTERDPNDELFPKESPNLWQTCSCDFVLRPPARFIFPDLYAITGFQMNHVLDSYGPEHPGDAYVAVIQGRDVGYFKSWSVAAVHVQLLGAAYSLHLSLREARLCYLRALVGKQVFFIGDDGLSESMVTPVIPSGYTLETWWSMCWKDWDRNDDIPVPTIRP